MTRRTDQGPVRRPIVSAIAICVVGAAAALLYSNFVFAWVIGGTDPWAVVSLLEERGAPQATLLRITDVVCGVLVLALLPGVRRGLPAGWWREAALWLTAVFAVCSALSAVFQLPSSAGVAAHVTDEAHAQRVLHDGLSILSTAALYFGAVGAAVASRRGRLVWFHRAGWLTFWVGGVGIGSLFAVETALEPFGTVLGAIQRVHIVVMSMWIVCLTILAASSGLPGRQDRTRRSHDDMTDA